jgi:ABC-type transport system involved in multi-copper enzyme maturation permease subunit
MKKQFIEDILTFRFLISVVLILAAIAVLSFIFAGHYNSLQAAYTKASAQNDRSLQEFARSPSGNLGAVNLTLILKPRPELFLAEGGEEDFPQSFYYRARQHSLQVQSPKEEAVGTQVYGSISKKERFSDVLSYSSDLTFIVQLVLSFFALVLAFDAVTAEKEKGTLRLIYSNPAKRAYFIIAKYLSALSTFAVALLLGLLVSIIVLTLLSTVSISTSIITSFSLFFLVALLYLSTFILLGMTCSVSSHSSKNSLVLCILIWIFLVVVLPKSTGMFITSKRYNVPTSEEINQMAEDASYETGTRLQKQMPPEVLANWQKYGRSEQVLEFYSEMDKVRQDMLDLYLHKKLSAVEEVRKMNMLSPASLFEYAAACVAGTGLDHFENLWVQARRYESDFETFVKDERSGLEKGAFFYLNENTIMDKPLDFNAIPKFEDKLSRPGERLKDALPYIGILALYNLFLFAFVIYRFQTYDVR